MQKNKIISLDGIDVFENGQSIELVPLTVLTGLNGSGKTAILNTIERQYKNTKRWKWPGMSLITDGIKSKEGDVLLFEQPEAGLHPKLQLEAMDLFIEAATHERIVVVETHSDHMINRLIRRVMERYEYLNDRIKIYFLDMSESGSRIDSKEINKYKGTLKDKSGNFFDQHKSELSAIVDTGMNNLITDKRMSNSSTLCQIPIDEVDGALCEYENFFYQFSNETGKITDTGYKNLLKRTSEVQPIQVDQKKGIVSAPKDFFSQFATETMDIAQIGYENYRRGVGK